MFSDGKDSIPGISHIPTMSFRDVARPHDLGDQIGLRSYSKYHIFIDL